MARLDSDRGDYGQSGNILIQQLPADLEKQKDGKDITVAGEKK